ncbi:DUF6496 domain-containing protein [Granulibacter bethesdensis]|uniref:Uncharacterized protein n=1 Tax=Granulibacter bethesdensis (strain ATCC BAA-1260 / CGDNIH1) TaxID=391165 RepID=Q0BW12_GRABC|nr:DUF6496 domain-containing protein [Granulibacter bethesdensis]ABI60990.1 Hypothetical protein GbCGDNIH1_0092 [Granulibacter bethesdensis CGDNIH1]AHJ67075.1 Hypothetical protein GbCGDNIH2_0092 [Granulibacter bethesdensis]APH50759.1 Hypothetical protein GbCGDNIH5_0092 [Granulibacter bethesdensis]APH63454.1 Hypothetical protein GbCGDNIH1I4_0092 [Granulibacter bethesdensis]
MAKQSKEQQATIRRVMHEFKHGELKTRAQGGKNVQTHQQAIAIALHEAGETNQESDQKNKQNLKRTKEKERKGQTAQAKKEGKASQDRILKRDHARDKRG